MRPLRFSINVTLDGCIDHRVMVPDEDLHRHAARHIAGADVLIFGRVTYQLMEVWRDPVAVAAMPAWTHPFAKAIDAAKKYVVSTTLERVDWNAEVVRGDLEAFVRQLKQQPGNGLFVGGATLATALTELRLIDEYEFIVHPRVAGHGPRLFDGLSKLLDLRLVDEVAFRSGAVAMRYQPV